MLWFEIQHLVFLSSLTILGIIFIRCAIKADWISKNSRWVFEPSESLAWPKVTVQIPIRNELNVVGRVLRSVAKLRYPSEQLEIQVLDDSDDATCGRLNALVEDLRASGSPKLEVIRRSRAEGFKAGAMANGLAVATGEFIAIFDADCIPEPGFLLKVIPYFTSDPRVGMVQGRWGFINRNHSWLTRVQAIILDSLMLVEQPVRFIKKSPFQFNGCGGIWRRSCIESSGGWRAVSVAEDLDLSFRALLRGWRFIHLSGVVVDTELPEALSSYRFQQKRWTCGSAQVLRELFLPILCSARPLTEVTAMFLHLGRRTIFPLLMFITLLAPFIAFEWIPVSVPFGLFFNLGVWALFTGGFLLTLIQGHRLLGKSVGEVVVLYPIVIGLFIGMSFTCSASFFSGLFRRNCPFIRTPKKGNHDDDEKPLAFYASKFDRFSLSEVLIGILYLVFTYVALKRGMVFEPIFFFSFSISYLAVGGSALYERFSFSDGAIRLASPLGRVRPCLPPYQTDEVEGFALSSELGI